MKINIKNNQKEFSRVRLISKNSDNYIIANIGVDNPTLIIDDNKNLSVCLSPNTDLPCEGAIGYADTGGVWGDFIININGTDYYEPYGPEVSEILYIDNSEGELHWKWFNKTPDTLRVEIRNCVIYKTDYGWEENSNPTRILDFEEKTIKFCLSEGIVCETIEAEILEIEGSLSPGTYYINYRVNNGEIKTRTFTIDTDKHPYDVASGLFGYVSDDKGWRLFILGGGSQAFGEDGEYHPAPFWAYLFRGSVAAAETVYGENENYVNEPVTVEFISTPGGMGTDAVDLYFGQTTVLHACSYKTWVGV